MLVRELLFELGFDADRAQKNAKKMDKVVVRLKKNLVLMGAAAVTAAIGVGLSGAKIIDEYKGLENRIKLVTDSVQGLQKAQEGVFNIAQKTGTEYASSADLYIRLARSTKRFGYDQEQILQVTESIQKALVVSGDAGKESAKAALFQLGQGLQSGTLRGQELNSVLEQAPRIAEAIAAGMGIKQEDLRTQAEAGKITAQEVMKALLKQAKTIDAEFLKMDATQAQSKMRLANAYKKLVFEINNEEDIQKDLVAFWDELRKIVESEDFKKSLKFLINAFVKILGIAGTLVIGISKLISIFSDLIDSFGGLDDIISIVSSALIAFGTVAIARAVLGLISLISTLGWGFTAAWLFNGALSVMAGLMALITWPVVLAIAAFAALFLVVQDLWAFFSGGDSITGRFLDKLSEWSQEFLGWIETISENWDELLKKIAMFNPLTMGAALGDKIGNFAADNLNPMNWFGDGEEENTTAQAIANAQVNQRNASQNNINITVPAGSSKEQAEYIGLAVENAVDNANQRQLREARNNFPEVE